MEPYWEKMKMLLSNSFEDMDVLIHPYRQELIKLIHIFQQMKMNKFTYKKIN
jgi:hypothetical protein